MLLANKLVLVELKVGRHGVSFCNSHHGIKAAVLNPLSIFCQCTLNFRKDLHKLANARYR